MNTITRIIKWFREIEAEQELEAEESQDEQAQG